ncbi:MAG: hypothetical protein HQK49_09015 [Oligoflexia bacterium]|nr:hypothetical protein [Oligoflexia bacterium]
MINKVVLTKRIQKELLIVPTYIAIKLKAWVLDVETRGLEEVRKIPGYHDEPLKGTRQGERSIRLSRSYRAIYEIKDNGIIEFVSLKEIHKHEY